MTQIQTGLANRGHFLSGFEDKAFCSFNGLCLQQISRAIALLSAVIGSSFLGQAGAEAGLKDREVRRAGSTPVVTGNIPTQSAFPDTLFSLKISPTGYFTDSDSGGFKLDVVEKSSQTPLSWLNLELEEIHYLSSQSSTLDTSRDLHIVGNLAYIANGFSGLSIVDISNPNNPILLGSRDTPGDASGIDVEGNYAYIADYTSGLQIIDVSNPNNPTMAGSYEGSVSPRTLDVEGNFAYLAGSSGGLKIVDVSDPYNPTLAGIYGASANGIQTVGNLTYVASPTSGLQIIDVSNSSATTLTGSYDLTTAYNVRVLGNLAYIADINFGLYIIDVSDPTDPTLAGSYRLRSGAFGLDVSGHYAYITNDVDNLQVFDVSNPSAPTLIGTYFGKRLSEVSVIGNFIYSVEFSFGLTILEETLQLSGTPKTTDIGNYELELIAEDLDLNRVSSTFTLRIESPPVVASSISNQLINVQAPFNLFLDQAVFPDPNDDVVHYTAKKVNQTALPAWLSFSPIGIFSGTPQSSDTGTYDIQVEAFDGTVLTRANTTFSLTVDHFPEVSATITNQAAEIAIPYYFQVPTGTFIDQDIGDTLSYNSNLGNGSPLPTWLSFNSTNLQFTGTPFAGDVGALTIALSATDTPGAVASTTFTLAVGEFPALLNPISSQLAATGTRYRFSIPGDTFTTPPGEILSYSASQADGSLLPAWLGFVGPRLEFQGTPQPSDKGAVSLKVVAEDSKGGTAQSLFDLSVIDTLSQEVARIGGSFNYQIPDDMISSPLGSVTYTVTLKDGSPLPAWLNYNPAANTISGVPPDGSDGAYSLLVTADDGVQPPVLGILTLNINPNAPPKVANPISSQTAQVGQTYTLVVPDNTFADPNDDLLTLSAKRVNEKSLPSWLTFTDRTLTGKPNPGDTDAFSDRTVPLQICATDDNQEACSTFDLTVQGTSNAETAVAILGPLVGAIGLAFGWYNKRGLLLNPWNREKYDKGTISVAIGTPFNYTFEAPKSEIKLIQAFEGRRMFGSLPAPKSLDEKGWLEWIKQDKPITGGNLLPCWLTYKEGGSELVSSSGPSQNDVGLYTVRAFAQGEIILEEVKLNVCNKTDKEVLL